MVTWYVLYTSNNKKEQEACQTAREALQVYGCNYKEFPIEEDGIKEMFSEKGLRSCPQVFKEGKHIGGLRAIENHLRESQIDKEKEFRARKHVGTENQGT